MLRDGVRAPTEGWSAAREVVLQAIQRQMITVLAGDDFGAGTASMDAGGRLLSYLLPSTIPVGRSGE